MYETYNGIIVYASCPLVITTRDSFCRTTCKTQQGISSSSWKQALAITKDEEGLLQAGQVTFRCIRGQLKTNKGHEETAEEQLRDINVTKT